MLGTINVKFHLADKKISLKKKKKHCLKYIETM